MPSRSATRQNGHPVPADKSAEPLIVSGREGALETDSDTFLEAIARGTGGTIVKLGLASSDLGTLYESKIEPLARRQHEASRLAGKAERFPLFLLSALVLLDPRLFAGQSRLVLALELARKPRLASFCASQVAASLLVSLAVLAAGAARRPAEVLCGVSRVRSGPRNPCVR